VTEPGAGWEAPDYDDSSWDLGKGAFGRMDSADPRVRTTWDTGRIWLRSRFPHEVGAKGILHARVFHDEDAKIYLNGSLVADLRGHVNDYRGIEIPVLHLRNGDNLIAVQCSHTTGGQFIDVGLSFEKTFEKTNANPTIRNSE
jgi:beta-galactosidase